MYLDYFLGNSKKVFLLNLLYLTLLKDFARTYLRKFCDKSLGFASAKWEILREAANDLTLQRRSLMPML
jgi:hypothetical protein